MQTFTAGKNGWLSKLDLWLTPLSHGPTTNVETISIKATRDGLATGDVLASVQVTAPTYVSTASAPISFAHPAWVNAGQQYAIVISEANISDQWLMSVKAGGGYAGGALYRSSNVPSEGDDLFFRTWVDEQPADARAPMSDINAAPPLSGDAKWFLQPPTLIPTAYDFGGSGVAALRCWVDPSQAPRSYFEDGWVACPEMLGYGAHRVWVSAIDLAGNTEAPHMVPINIDNVAPFVQLGPTTLPNSYPWFTAKPALFYQNLDLASGPAATRCWVDPTTPPSGWDSPGFVDCPAAWTGADGVHTIWLVGTDVAGNVSAPRSNRFFVDTKPPASNYSGISAGWSRTPEPVTLTPTDATSGVAVTYYTIGSNWPTTSSPKYDPANKPVLQNGQKITVMSVDAAGNQERPITSIAAKVDGVAPVTTASGITPDWSPAPETVTLAATDAASGVQATYYTIGTDPAAPTTASTKYDPASKPVVHDGERIRFFSIDVAGNAEADQTSAAAKVDAAVPDTAIDAAPEADTADSTPAIAFSTIAVDATFECSLDDAAFAPCASPYTPGAALSEGAHAFAVRTISRARLTDPTPAQATFTVDTVRPAAPRVSGEPEGTSATFTFTGEDGATFTCSFDGAETACSSPASFTGLAAGTHRFAVTQTDGAGNVSGEATVSFAVQPPQVSDATPTPTPTAAPSPIPTLPPPRHPPRLPPRRRRRPR